MLILSKLRSLTFNAILVYQYQEKDVCHNDVICFQTLESNTSMLATKKATEIVLLTFLFTFSLLKTHKFQQEFISKQLYWH